MKTDLYTKTVLTIIAIFLGLNFLKEIEIIPAAKANTTATAAPTPPAAQAAPVDVNITHIMGEPLGKYWNYIPVTIQKNYDK